MFMKPSTMTRQHTSRAFVVDGCLFSINHNRRSPLITPCADIECCSGSDSPVRLTLHAGAMCKVIPKKSCCDDWEEWNLFVFFVVDEERKIYRENVTVRQTIYGTRRIKRSCGMLSRYLSLVQRQMFAKRPPDAALCVSWACSRLPTTC